jgi:hypothetical protein
MRKLYLRDEKLQSIELNMCSKNQKADTKGVSATRTWIATVAISSNPMRATCSLKAILSAPKKERQRRCWNVFERRSWRTEAKETASK